MQGSSEQPGFYKLPVAERLKLVQRLTGLTDEEVRTVSNTGGLPAELADRMIENVIGGITMPLGIATNFQVNGKDYLIPMALEEASVVAAASNTAKMARAKGGFHVTNTGPVMIGQIQTVEVRDPYRARMDLMLHKEEILSKANEQDPMLVSLGGGAKDLRVRVLSSIKGPMVIAELIVSTGDAMGANAVNTMAEAVAPIIERVTGGQRIPEDYLQPGRPQARPSLCDARQGSAWRRRGRGWNRLRLRLCRGRSLSVLDAQQGYHERGHRGCNSLRPGHQGS